MMAVTSNPPRLRGGGPRSGGGGTQPLQRPIVYSARKLRKDMSLPEVLLWQELRGNKTGAKFRRQHPIGPYVADFYCAAVRLIIEIDGEAHNRADRPDRDIIRDKFLVDAGYRIFRLAAVDILNNLEAVVQAISLETESPLHRASAAPLPASGEDFL